MLLHAVFFMPVYCLSLALPLSEVYTFPLFLSLALLDALA
mgnify:CR=1 FL=1